MQLGVRIDPPAHSAGHQPAPTYWTLSRGSSSNLAWATASGAPDASQRDVHVGVEVEVGVRVDAQPFVEDAAIPQVQHAQRAQLCQRSQSPVGERILLVNASPRVSVHPISVRCQGS